MSKPLCIDLFAGLGGWTEGFLAEGYDVVGFDIERHRYPRTIMLNHFDGSKVPTQHDTFKKTGKPCGKFTDPKYASGESRQQIMLDEWHEYPAQLVLQDVLTLHGSQFRNAACIVASPPCQEFSYAAQPWKRAKAEVPEVLPAWWDKPEPKMSAGEMAEWQLWKAHHPAKPPDTALFDACFRIQREASEAAGRHVPLVVENVKGAQKWVGRAQWHYGSFYLWGDVPALMPSTLSSQKFNPDGTNHGQGSRFAIADSNNRGSGRKVPGMNFHEHEKTGKPGRSFQSAAVEGAKACAQTRGLPNFDRDDPRRVSGAGVNRKAASAQIAKIPFELSLWVAYCYRPVMEAACSS